MDYKNGMSVSVRDLDYVDPYVHWEKVFYFDGGDGHRVIYGHHTGGGFIAIPNMHISCEAAEGTCSVDWNRDSMISAGVNAKYASAIAEYINSYNNELTEGET